VGGTGVAVGGTGVGDGIAVASGVGVAPPPHADRTTLAISPTSSSLVRISFMDVMPS
jgi:hypothetical protein